MPCRMESFHTTRWYSSNISLIVISNQNQACSHFIRILFLKSLKIIWHWLCQQHTTSHLHITNSMSHQIPRTQRTVEFVVESMSDDFETFEEYYPYEMTTGLILIWHHYKADIWDSSKVSKSSAIDSPYVLLTVSAGRARCLWVGYD